MATLVPSRCFLNHLVLSSSQPQEEVLIVTIPILWMKNLRLSEINQLAPKHVISWQPPVTERRGLRGYVLSRLRIMAEQAQLDIGVRIPQGSQAAFIL